VSANATRPTARTPATARADEGTGPSVGGCPSAAMGTASITRRTLRLAALAIAVCAAAAGSASAERWWPSFRYPSEGQLERATAFAQSRDSPVAFAVLRPHGGVRGYQVDLPFSSASASKVLLLAAELQRLRDAGLSLDAATRQTLTAMISYSDNDAANAVYARVGDAGMAAVAELAGMGSFAVVPGYWGGAQITAADLARFYLHLRRNLVQPYRRFGLRVLETIAEEQRWGIPQAAGRGWRIWFKGGWRPYELQETSGPVTHQGALLRYRQGQELALAVLTGEPPGTYGGYAAVEGVAKRLLRPPPAGPRRWPAN
jgi:beta-lactamase class A